MDIEFRDLGPSVLKRFAIALLGAAGLGMACAQTASAADMAVKAPKAAPVAVAAYNWSGFYVGAHLGGGWGNPNWTDRTDPAFAMLFADYVAGQGFNHSIQGIIGGGHAGYNWQAGSWVFGLEASYSGADIKGTYRSTVGGADDNFEARIRSLFLATGRVGYASANWLFYGKGGYAGADVSTSVSDTVGVFAFQVGAGNDRHWHSGWTAGAGVEYALASNWIVGVEYDYVRLQSKNHELGSLGGSYLWSVDPNNLHMVVGRVSYKFGGPVVARY